MTHILINGEEKETINTNDRGLLYGDGLFETMAVRNNRIHLWEAHWQRLSLGCEKLSINLPAKLTVETELALLIKNNDEAKFVIKLIITRGEGQRGYRITGVQNATRILSCYPWPNYSKKYQAEGVDVCYCKTTLSENKKLAGVKHLNRLEQVLARNEWNDEFQEGLMLTAQGNIVDGTMSNIFAVKDNEIFTPNLSLSGVDGVMRRTVIKAAKEKDFSVYEKDLRKTELEQSDEVFLTNSLFGVWPVKTIEKTRFTIVGGVTKTLQEEINKICYK